MSRTNVRFVKTSKLLWHTYTLILVLVLILPKPTRAQTDNSAQGDTVCTVSSIDFSGPSYTGACGLPSLTTGSYNSAFGVGALNSATVASDNTATGYLALYSDKDGYDNTATGVRALYSNIGAYNTATGYGTLYLNINGTGNTADGFKALLTNSTGGYNTAEGYEALYSNTSGSYNTAVGLDALYSNTTGSELTCVGYDCRVSAAALTGDDTPEWAHALTNATAIGAHAVVSQSNSLVLGGTGDHAVKVGIGTTTPSNILTMGRGTGDAIADGWDTYSSRRWKSNIRTLDGALAKVEQLRGVSYDLKDSGKHEIGVIAEEVGQVVPEVVSYEKNGKDATGVDYSRLTVLLIEATKQQQREIRQQQAVLRTQAAAIRDLKSELRVTRQTLQKVQAQVAATQPALVAAK
jgi:hypothetical protein